MIFLRKYIPTSRLYFPSADREGLAFLEVFDRARQARLHAGCIVRELRRRRLRAFHCAGVRQALYQSGAEIKKAGRSPRVAR
jgi:hypothetical protein